MWIIRYVEVFEKKSSDLFKFAKEPPCGDFSHSLISIEEYRDIIKDKISSEEQITKRLIYLEAFCKKIIDLEINKFMKNG